MAARLPTKAEAPRFDDFIRRALSLGGVFLTNLETL